MPVVLPSTDSDENRDTSPFVPMTKEQALALAQSRGAWKRPGRYHPPRDDQCRENDEQDRRDANNQEFTPTPPRIATPIVGRLRPGQIRPKSSTIDPPGTDSSLGLDSSENIVSPESNQISPTSAKKKGPSQRFKSGNKWASRSIEDPFARSTIHRQRARQETIALRRRETPELKPVERPLKEPEQATTHDPLLALSSSLTKNTSLAKLSPPATTMSRPSSPDPRPPLQSKLRPKTPPPAPPSTHFDRPKLKAVPRRPSPNALAERDDSRLSTPCPRPPRSPDEIKASVNLDPSTSNWRQAASTRPQRPARQKSRTSSCVTKLAAIQKKRQERRENQAKQRQKKTAEAKKHGSDESYKFRQLIQAYRVKYPLSQYEFPSRPNLTTVLENRLSVYVRKRPLNGKELANVSKGYDIISCKNFEQVVLHEPKYKVDLTPSLDNTTFEFDGIFNEHSQNAELYAQILQPLVADMIQHQRIITVFAYGQTGSGKTYTMRSIVRAVAYDLFDAVAKYEDLHVFFSFYEIYNSKVYDLLAKTQVQLMEDNEGQVQIVGLEKVAIQTPQMLLNWIEKGEEARATSKNAIHNDSSRSHAIAKITICHHERKYCDLSLVDLAGSERAGDTQTDTKTTRMEGAEINKSLLALKECIRALDRQASHIPFRGSKLTQILRDSFINQHSKTIMIATISPSAESSNYTLNTLRYADRLKEIHSR